MPLPAALITAVNAAFHVGNILDTIDNILPSLEEECDVVVYGNPNASLYNLYWQAVAVAFGILGKDRRNGGETMLPPAGLIMMEYSLEEKRIRFYVKQVTSWIGNIVTAGPIGGFPRLKPNGPIQLFTGPPAVSEFKGGAWQWNAAAVPGFPGFGGPAAPIIGKLPLGGDLISPLIDPGYTGRVILTERPTYKDKVGAVRPSRSPSPPGDGISRGNPTVANDPNVKAMRPLAWYRNPEYLLFTALSDPCDVGSQFYDETLTTSPGGPIATDLTAGDYGGGGDFDVSISTVPKPDPTEPLPVAPSKPVLSTLPNLPDSDGPPTQALNPQTQAPNYDPNDPFFNPPLTDPLSQPPAFGPGGIFDPTRLP